MHVEVHVITKQNSTSLMQAQEEPPPPDQGSAKQSEPPKTEDSDGRSAFACNICFDSASDPVVTKCGHLYCWPCIHSWLEVHATKDAANCPVCKSGVYKADLIPIYGRGKEKTSHAMFNAPPRPAGQRVEPVRWMGGNGGMGGNFTFSAGFGFFPMLNMQFVWLDVFDAFSRDRQQSMHGSGGPTQARDPRQRAQEVEQTRMSQLLFLLGTLVVLFLLIWG